MENTIALLELIQQRLDAVERFAAVLGWAYLALAAACLVMYLANTVRLARSVDRFADALQRALLNRKEASR